MTNPITREKCLKLAREAGLHHFYWRGDQEYHCSLTESLVRASVALGMEMAAKKCEAGGRSAPYVLCASEIRKLKQGETK